MRDSEWSKILGWPGCRVYRAEIEEAAKKLAGMPLDQLEGILNHCRTKVLLGVVEAVNGNIKPLLRRGRGYKHICAIHT